MINYNIFTIKMFLFFFFQCNNPMTKEAKLQAAMRILPEWVGYDEEIKGLQQKLENANRQTEKDSGMRFYNIFFCVCILLCILCMYVGVCL